ncbi:MAG: glycosyltransferase family 4 protein [Verrucomicrobia bacterium]|nr:glycosyltransferase family 4 protein [Verrucomicrobiota bacterium]
MDRLIISDIPTPWREPVFERVHRRLDGAVEVVYFKDNEKRRLWTFPMGRHPKTILPAITLKTGETERFLNLGLAPLLIRRRPRVAVVSACIKDPSGWIAMVLCRLLGTKVALLDDSWLGREQGIGRLQRVARRLTYRWLGDAYVGSSLGTLALHRHYNPSLRADQCFLSHLVGDNEFFQRRLAGRQVERRFDVLFSGRIVDVKNPVFFAEVGAAIKARLGRCRVLIIGEGEERLKAQMRAVFAKHDVHHDFAGFIQHQDLPDYYAQARLLLLPTSGDCWGVVINEAMVSGTPVITTEWTAAAGELVLHEQNGYVLPLDVNRWAEAASNLLSDEAKWNAYSANGRAKVAEFNYDRAATGILDAFAYLEGLVNARVQPRVVRA